MTENHKPRGEDNLSGSLYNVGRSFVIELNTLRYERRICVRVISEEYLASCGVRQKGEIRPLDFLKKVSLIHISTETSGQF